MLHSVVVVVSSARPFAEVHNVCADPVNVGRGASFRVQIQFYNMWNQVQFRSMNVGQTFNTSGVNTSSGTGKYTDTTNPFNGGVTVRFDY